MTRIARALSLTFLAAILLALGPLQGATPALAQPALCRSLSALASAGNLDGAQTQAQALLAETPSVKAHVQMCTKAVLRQIARLRAKAASAFFAGNAEYRKGDFAEALKDYRQATAIDSGSGAAARIDDTEKLADRSQGQTASSLTDWLKAWGLLLLWAFGIVVVLGLGAYVVVGLFRNGSRRPSFFITPFVDPTDNLKVGASFTASLVAELRHAETDGSLGIVRDEPTKDLLPDLSLLPDSMRFVATVLQWLIKLRSGTLTVKGTLVLPVGSVSQAIVSVARGSKTVESRTFSVGSDAASDDARSYLDLVPQIASWLYFSFTHKPRRWLWWERPIPKLLGTRDWQSYALFRQGVSYHEGSDSDKQRARTLYLEALERDAHNNGALTNLAALDTRTADDLSLARAVVRLTQARDLLSQTSNGAGRRSDQECAGEAQWYRLTYLLAVTHLHRCICASNPNGVVEGDSHIAWLNQALTLTRLLVKQTEQALLALHGDESDVVPPQVRDSIRSLNRARESALRHLLGASEYRVIFLLAAIRLELRTECPADRHVFEEQERSELRSADFRRRWMVKNADEAGDKTLVDAMKLAFPEPQGLVVMEQPGSVLNSRLRFTIFSYSGQYNLACYLARRASMSIVNNDDDDADRNALLEDSWYALRYALEPRTDLVRWAVIDPALRLLAADPGSAETFQRIVANAGGSATGSSASWVTVANAPSIWRDQ